MDPDFTDTPNPSPVGQNPTESEMWVLICDMHMAFSCPVAVVNSFTLRGVDELEARFPILDQAADEVKGPLLGWG